MSKSRAYSAVDVQRLSMESLLAERPVGQVWAGVDVGKDECMMVLRWQDGSFERPIRWRNPGQIPLAVDRLVFLSERGWRVTVAMESSGTYGDAFRQALSDAGLAVQRVSGKAVSDYAEIFDGVPSQHDGKDAAMLAELGAIGKGAPWAWQSPAVQDQYLRHHVDLLDVYQRQWLEWTNRTEAWLARHWPEVSELLALGSVTMLELLAAYGSPEAVAKDPQAAARMAGWGGGLLAPEKIARVVESAGKTLGVRTTQADRERVQWIAQEALRCLRQVQAHRKAVVKYGADCPDVQALSPALGQVTACVLHAEAGDPLEYSCGRAYQKALGLNLKERSSGKFKGEVKITKRGSGLARRWLYFTALRLIYSNATVAEWYARKVARDGGERKRAVVAVMRKVALGAQCCRRDGVAFDPDRLFGTGCGRLQEAVKGR